jgi:GT2 family glycosyltransferase
VNAVHDNLYSTASHLLIEYLYSYYNAVPEHARFFTPNNLTLPRGHFSGLGGFDPSFVRGTGEDREFCDRWLRCGYRLIYAPEVQVSHVHALTFRTFWRQHVNYGRGSYRYHLTRSQRDAGPIEFEPLRFYLNLLRSPLAKAREKRRLRLIVALGIAQVANAAGFFWESRRTQDYAA